MDDSGAPVALQLYREAIVWDTHSGFMPDPATDLENLAIWHAAGIGYLSVNVGFDLFPWSHTVDTLNSFRTWILAHSEKFTLAATTADVRSAKRSGRMAIAFDIEGTNALNGQIEMIDFYYRLGVRQMLIAYNRNNIAGGGCHDTDQGLTDFGRAVVMEMNRVGMIVDASHCGLRTSMDVMECSTQPVIFSHSNPKALCPHERNVTDDQIRACAKTGGIIGVVGIRRFLGPRGDDAHALADHVEYLVNLVGAKHVGIGLDYVFPQDSAGSDDMIRANRHYWPPERGYETTETSFAAPTELAPMTEILLQRGLSGEDLRGILGLNFLRLADSVWS